MATCKLVSNMGMAVRFCMLILPSLSMSTEVNRTVLDDWVIETRTAKPLPILLITETVKLVNDSADGNETVLFTAPPPQESAFTHRLMTIPTLLEEVCPRCMPVFEGGDEFYRSVTTWNNLACGDSVCNKTYNVNVCGPFQCDQCHCDDDCIRYGDCCPDYFIRVHNAKREAKLSCISQAFIPLNPSSAVRYKMVSNCPEATTISSTQLSHMVKCHNPHPDDVQENIPVYSLSTHFHYKNRNCALCHNVQDFTYWGTHTFCDALVEVPALTSQRHLLDFFRSEDLCAVYFTPPEADGGRKCKHTAELINTCNVTGEWQEYDANMEEACSLFVQPIPKRQIDNGFISYDEPFFQNVFCAQCNGVELYVNNACGNFVVFPEAPPFSVIFNLHGARGSTTLMSSKTPTVSCKSSYVYDPFTASCRQLFCSYGKMAKNHRCVNLIQSAKSLGYILHAEFTPRNKESVMVIELTRFAQKFSHHVKWVVVEASSIFSVTNLEITFIQINESLSIQVYKIDVQFSILVGVQIPREEVETQLVNIRHRGWWWYEDANDVNSVFFDVRWLSGLSDQRLSMNPQYALTLTLDGPFDIVRKVTFQLVDEVGLLMDLPVRYRTDTSSYILVNELLLCDMIELNSTEFSTTSDGNILVKGSRHLLRTGDFSWYNSSVLVCVNTSASEQQMHTPTDNNNLTSVQSDDAEVWLTIICTALSLLCLAATMLVYIVRGRQKFLPGKNSIFLFANLFLAQLLFLTGATAKVSTPGCRALGIIIHYFWLATFCWKVVCAYHMYWLLANPLKTFHKTKSFAVYVMFSHCVPLLFIALVIAINCGMSNLERIGYADRLIGKDHTLCFLTSALDLGVGFVLPVSLTIIINIYLFFRIVKSLRNSEQAHVRQSSKSKRKESVLYFKISVIFGFSWLLGFIALIVNVQGMWFLFTVVNCSIGVFVFLSFGLKNLPVKLLSSADTSTDVPTPMSSPRPMVRYLSQDTLNSVTPSPVDSPVRVRRDNHGATGQ